jgi:hypothetical protein
LDRDHLVTDGGESGGEEDDQVWLDGGGSFGVLSNGLDGIESAFPCVRILFVGKLLLEGCDRAVVDRC